MWRCEVSIQDGTERWDENNLQQAIFSVIRMARVMNGSFITRDDIKVVSEIKVVNTTDEISKQDQDLLHEIKSNRKIALDCSDPRIKYRITKDECDMIIKIREGDFRVVSE